jgi:Polysaccharide lyase
VLAVRYIGGVVSITQDLNHQFIVLYHEKRDLRRKWLDLRFEVRFSPHPDGRIRAWLDDKQVVNYSGITANVPNAATGYPDPSYFPFKMGLYRNVMPQPMTIYLDEYRKRHPPKCGNVTFCKTASWQPRANCARISKLRQGCAAKRVPGRTWLADCSLVLGILVVNLMGMKSLLPGAEKVAMYVSAMADLNC